MPRQKYPAKSSSYAIHVHIVLVMPDLQCEELATKMFNHFSRIQISGNCLKFSIQRRRRCTSKVAVESKAHWIADLEAIDKENSLNL
ncbi:uncharacterized protein G2W53_041572 [Senna tora]|uniref:Uncharacterized protein n=1 Tax=Senna tora TaxID=362788 RepID=A0A834W1K0_9FABA|nr:uncharacterized protein G2W53_041572 [Senna tora]